ncbi:MAG: SPOR domain-containing protein [Spirochaetaceae bacterium]|nr:SPOR domain-containing protein [Spirochaetaceae bacterium]
MKRLCLLLAACIFAASFVFGSSVAWEGRAAVGSADIFPAGGNYAQSRVFSKGEIVEVYNTLNGKKINVVITDTTELTGVLILLSPAAAEELEVSAAYDTVVRISRKNDYVAEGTTEGGSLASVPDPDTNAAEALKEDYVFTEETAEEVVAATSEVAEATETEPANTSSVSAYEYASLPEITQPQVTVTTVQTQPVQETAPVVSQTTPVTQTTPVQTAPVTTTVVPAQTAAVTNTQPQVQSNAVIVPQDQYKQNVPYPELQITEYEKNKYYVQLSVNRDVANIRNIVSKYRGKYPVSLKQSNRFTDAYEVLIGPLSADEYNAILSKVKKDGYKDAFVKRGY